MIHRKNNKKALTFSLLSLLLCMAMLVGSTFAWFTDNATTKVNTIQAGTLDIELLAAKEANAESLENKELSFIKAEGHKDEKVLFEPGAKYKLQDAWLYNAGNLHAKYQVVISGINGDSKLAEVLEVFINGNSTGKTLLELATTGNGIVKEGTIAPETFDTFGTIELMMQTDANNDYQGLSLSGIAITVMATQDAVEYDSHNNTYDAGAVYGDSADIPEDGMTAVVNGTQYATLQEAIAAAKPGDIVKLLANIEATEQILIDKDLTLDLGNFRITGNNADAIVRIASPAADTTINVTINADNGGIVNKGTGYAIYAGEDISEGNDEERTNLTINGGNYETAGTDCIKQIMGLCTINDGNYKSSFSRTVLNGQQWYGAEFAINGGSFYGFNPACVSVWTGFDGKDYANFYHQHDILAEGKTAALNNGWYTVVDGNYTAKASTKSLCYSSVGEALQAVAAMNDVANLGVITLLDDYTMTEDDVKLAMEKGFSFICNGFELTLPEGYELYETKVEFYSGDVLMIKKAG